MTSILIPNKWNPRPYQLPVLSYFARGGKRAVLMWSRRLGKDDVSLHKTAISVVNVPGNYWHMLPEYGQARKAIWDAVDSHTGQRRIDWVFPKEIRASINESEMKITFKNGSVWQLCGSDSYDSLVGAGVKGVVFSEYALCKPEAWAYISPMLEENGGWALFNFTVRGQNHATQLAEYAEENKDWFFSNVRADESGVFTPEQLEKIKAELVATYGADLGSAMFRQEYMNDVSAFTSAYNSVFSQAAIERMAADSYPPAARLARVAGIDLARFGGDHNVIHVQDVLENQTRVEVETVAWKGTDAVFTQGKIADVLAHLEVEQAAIDGDGVGGPIIDNLRALCDGKDIVLDEWRNTALSSESPYGNKTTQAYFEAAELAMRGKLIIRSERVRQELGLRKFEYNAKGQRVLQQKKEWRRESGKSPDYADAAVLAGTIHPVARCIRQHRQNFARTEYDVLEER